MNDLIKYFPFLAPQASWSYANLLILNLNRWSSLALESVISLPCSSSLWSGKQRIWFLSLEINHPSFKMLWLSGLKYGAKNLVIKQHVDLSNGWFSFFFFKKPWNIISGFCSLVYRWIKGKCCLNMVLKPVCLLWD